MLNNLGLVLEQHEIGDCGACAGALRHFASPRAQSRERRRDIGPKVKYMLENGMNYCR
jgi:hypothetical protein